MKSQEYIFRLIKSMDKQEKWYFKQYANDKAINGKNNYALLFDAIDAIKVYDEKKLKTKFPDLSFAETKYQLFGNILKALHGYYLQSSIDSSLYLSIHQTEILFQKGLYSEALKLIRKSKVKSYKHERFSHLLQLLEWERQTIIYSYDYSAAIDFIDDIYKEINAVHKLLQNQTDYAYLSNSLFLLHSKNGVIRDTVSQKAYTAIIKNPLLKNPAKALTYEAKVSYFHCYIVYWFAHQDFTNYYEACRNHLAALEEKPFLIEQKILRYIGSIYNCGLALIDIKELSGFDELVVKMRSITEKYKSAKNLIHQQTIFDMSYRLELRMYNSIGNFEKGIKVMKKAMPEFEKYSATLSDNSFILFYYEFAVASFGSGHYHVALDYIEKASQPRFSIVREDIVSILKVLQLVIHYELGNERLLPYIIKSTYRYLYKKERLFRTEQIILQYLRKLQKFTTRKELIASFTTLRDELLLLQSDTYEKIGLDYIDFISWLESKIYKKSYSELVSSNYFTK